MKEKGKRIKELDGKRDSTIRITQLIVLSRSHFLKAMCDAGKDPELYKKRVNEYILHNYNYCIHWMEKESQQIQIT